MRVVRLRGPPPQVFSCNAAISPCEKGQQPKLALHLLKVPQLLGLPPKVLPCNAATSPRVTGHQPLLALHRLRVLPIRGPTPKVISSNAAIRPYEKGHQPQQCPFVGTARHAPGIASANAVSPTQRQPVPAP